jgi:DNA repair ATPase RecN
MDAQTSHVLSRHVDVLDDNVFITARLIEAEKQEVVSRIVRATNSQSRVDTTQFVSLRPIVRRIEEYLESIDPTSDKAKVYLERREKQYTGMGIAEIRILDIRTLARAYASMFLDHPHLSDRTGGQSEGGT